MRKGDNTHLNANVKMVRANDCTARYSPSWVEIKVFSIKENSITNFLSVFLRSSPGLEHRLIVKRKLRIRTWDINLSLSMKFPSPLFLPHHTNHIAYFTNIKILLNRLNRSYQTDDKYRQIFEYLSTL